MRAAGWHFLPSGTTVPTRESLLGASAAGPAALSRELRHARARLGTVRAAALLRAAEAAAGGRFGQPLPLLLVTSQQPRALADALALGFAIAGFAPDISAIDGVQALRATLADAAAGNAAPFDSVRMTLFSMPADDNAAEGATLLAALAAEVAARSRAPVAIARFRLPGAPAVAPATGSDVAPLDIPVAAILDQRFGATFGAILTAEAADRLADAAAGFAARLLGTAPKLLITDLDGTLWDGVLGEPAGGPTGAAPPALHHAYAAALSTLRQRGLVVAVASRNDPADVDAALARATPLARDTFAARAVGWADKPALVAEVLATLGLAPEHAVFVDDDPVNCAAVAARFPAMDIRHFAEADDFAAELLADPLLLGGPGGAERAAQYQRRAAVEQLRDTAADEAAFRRSLQTRLTVLPLDAALRPRAAELASRVNQFLFTDLRPNALELAARPDGLDFIARLDDVFGAHGLVGLVLASRQGDTLRLDNLFLSCRALQRGVEDAMLHAVAWRAAQAGLARIVARVDILPRNEPARGVLARLGFRVEDGLWVHDLAESPLAVVPEGIDLIMPGEPS